MRQLRALIVGTIGLAFVAGTTMAQPSAAPTPGDAPTTASTPATKCEPRRGFPGLIRPNDDALLQQIAFPVVRGAPETGPFAVGARAYRSKNFAEALQLWTAAAAQGNARAAYFLAGMYQDGKGVPQDSVKAIALYRQAAEAGDTAPLTAPIGSSISNQAMLRLALIYETGFLATAEDLKVAMSGLGGYWAPGACIRDTSEAANWFRRWAGTIDPSSPYATRAASTLTGLGIQPPPRPSALASKSAVPGISRENAAAQNIQNFVRQAKDAEQLRLARWLETVPQGSGPAKVARLQPANLTTHTLYWPADWSKGPLPIVAWANGGCRNTSLAYAAFLSELASYGYFVIAVGNDDILPGIPTVRGRDGPTTSDGRPIGRNEAKALTEAVDWAIAENGRTGSPYRGKLETGKIAYMGHSCGAGQALNASKDPRTTTTVGLNSAFESYPPFFGENPWPTLSAPIAYFAGRWDDPANRHADENFAKARDANVPFFMAMHDDIEHSSAYSEPDPRWSVAVIAWLDWQLKGDRTAATMFVGANCGLCRSWNRVESRGVDVSPRNAQR